MLRSLSAPLASVVVGATTPCRFARAGVRVRS